MNFKTYTPTTSRTPHGKVPRISLYLANNQFRFNKYALMHLKVKSTTRAKFHFDNDRKTWLLEITNEGFKFNMNNSTTPIIQSKAVTDAIRDMYLLDDKTVYIEIGTPLMTTDKGTFYPLTII